MLREDLICYCCSPLAQLAVFSHNVNMFLGIFIFFLGEMCFFISVKFFKYVRGNSKLKTDMMTPLTGEILQLKVILVRSIITVC